MNVRQARLDDHDDVASFTRNTWPEHGGDYLADAFPDWIASDGPEQRTFVAEADGTVVGICQGVLLSEYEAWAQGMRVHLDYRGQGIAATLTDAVFGWARERGATVCRNMVFSWNLAGLGSARSVGFEPGIEGRWGHPTPDADASVTGFEVGEDPDAAWSCWRRLAASKELDGLALDHEETWALAELTRERLARAADADGLLTVGDDGGTHGVAFRVRDYEREADGESETWAEYGAAGWRDERAADALFGAIARDAARVGADRTRVLLPETPRHVSDAAVVGVEVSDDPVFVLEADLTGRA
ncbi:GNAT family N-acetyltransferase [Haloarculaceae archaeon H-GB2-1]|nr:GNAT family N-acetyltransferase [Haloarculaceae archaeon H-GB1-1]MEA5385987.1 GNAT family N-acetyltransferase [Haloarculaceae archaeon H-GB11]MEA5407493.1 GNAT family N-acetyltransferase [Haloarculaceae archaeon H-GB2-1]